MPPPAPKPSSSIASTGGRSPSRPEGAGPAAPAPPATLSGQNQAVSRDALRRLQNEEVDARGKPGAVLPRAVPPHFLKSGVHGLFRQRADEPPGDVIDPQRHRT